MSYQRVIPRDLFNEAMLLKCLGHLWILLEKIPRNNVKMELCHSDLGFVIDQDPSSGSIFVANLWFKAGDRLWLPEHPLNCRDPWPLILTPMDDDGDEFPVFTYDGQFTQDMLQLINP